MNMHLLDRITDEDADEGGDEGAEKAEAPSQDVSDKSSADGSAEKSPVSRKTPASKPRDIGLPPESIFVAFSDQVVKELRKGRGLPDVSAHSDKDEL